ncbi:MAG: AMP-binding protein [Alphaproteobacteria bacterium]|jgi:acetyl-CoA synthetase|nr:AMP-binding protein [Alphaproteobacteria bacterium]
MAPADDSGIKWRPTEEIVAASRMRAFLDECGLADLDTLNAKADSDPAWFWDAALRFLDVKFYKPYDEVLDLSRGAPWPDWCIGGTTNVVLNCLDKHRGTEIWDKIYVVWEGEDGAKRELTYAEFDAEVCRFAGALRERGYGRGDVIGLYLPMAPESYAAFFAVLKIGGIVLPLFSGFGPSPIEVRLNDGDAKAVVTADGTLRRAAPVAMKATLDAALADCPDVRDVFVIRRLGEAIDCPMTEGRDHWWHDATAGQPDHAPTEEMAAEDQGFLVYTSGTTGKPKGTVATHVGSVAKTALDVGLCFDIRADDRMLWISDMGWLVGPLTAISTSYFGASLLIVEGTPDYPDSTRHWRLMQDNQVTWCGIAPTTVRGMMRYGDEVDGFDFSSLRILASTGEPWTDEAWLWLLERVGGGTVPILNYCGGTECYGGIVSGTLLAPMKPGSFAGSMPGAGARVVDGDGNPSAVGELGELVMTTPSIGNTRGLWRDDERYMESYWEMYGNMWRQGDWAMIDEDGFWYVFGRSDDTINVAGKRTGPAEIEGALMSSGRISEAAVIGVPDPVKGSALCCVCVPMPGVEADEALRGELSLVVTGALGKSYRPKDILFVSDLPKTRNMKIMRRVVRSVILGEEEGDLSSLVNPEAVEELRAQAGV